MLASFLRDGISPPFCMFPINHHSRHAAVNTPLQCPKLRHLGVKTPCPGLSSSAVPGHEAAAPCTPPALGGGRLYRLHGTTLPVAAAAATPTDHGHSHGLA